MSKVLPSAIQDRPDLNLRQGIKSSLSNWRQLIASLYLFKMYGGPSFCKEVRNGTKTQLDVDDQFALWLNANWSSVFDVVYLVKQSELYSAQMEPLQVGLELFLKLAKVNFVDANLAGSVERTGGSRFAKRIRFSTNMKLLVDTINSYSESDRENFLKQWLSGTDDAVVSKRVKEVLVPFTEECQYKIRTAGGEISFQEDGVYAGLRNVGDTVESADVHESVGPFRIFKSYVKEGMHPYVTDSSNGFSVKTQQTEFTNYADMVRTTLELIPKRVTIYQEVVPTVNPKQIPLTAALQLFTKQRLTWTNKFSKGEPVYKNLNLDVRTFFGDPKNWDVAGLKSDVSAFKGFCSQHTWMLGFGKGWTSLSQYTDADRASFIDWVDEHIVKNAKPLAETICTGTGFKGVTNKAVTELLMKFHPDQYCLCNTPTLEALRTLGLLAIDVPDRYELHEYQYVMGLCAQLRQKIEDAGIARVDGSTNAPDYLTVNEFLYFVSEKADLIMQEWSKHMKHEIKLDEQTAVTEKDFAEFIKAFIAAAKAANLTYDDNLIKRFVCALLARPFVVLTGLSGSGKTKLAQVFTQWIATKDMYRIVPVGADWTNSEKLLGYPNALDPSNYILPDTGVLKLMIDANDNPTVPFFLILDEMNLSHVERYFADFLSAMESEGSIKLYDGKNRTADDGTPVPPTIPFPKNLFVIGTMNVDETTHAFSPKVLDRAQVIEFRVNEAQINAFLDKPTKPDLSPIEGQGVEYAAAFLRLHDNPIGLSNDDKTKMAEPLKKFFPVLAELSSEFAFRTASEAMKFCGFARKSVMSEEETVDAAIMQKLLPKLHGSRRRLAAPLEAFWEFCRKNGMTQTIADVCKKDATDKVEDVAKFPVSAEKIRRLYKAAEQNGFASYAEA